MVDTRNGVIKRGGQGKSPLKSGENHRIRYEDIGQSTRNGGFFRSHQNGAFPTLADTSKIAPADETFNVQPLETDSGRDSGRGSNF